VFHGWVGSNGCKKLLVSNESGQSISSLMIALELKILITNQYNFCTFSLN
jgi:hypothetical protein